MIGNLKAKLQQIKLKIMIYGFAKEIVKSKEDRDVIRKILDALKSVSDESFSKELVSQMAPLIHQQALREKESSNYHLSENMKKELIEKDAKINELEEKVILLSGFIYKDITNVD